MITLTIIGILIYLYGGWVFYKDFIKNNLNLLEIKQNVFEFLSSGFFLIATILGILILFKIILSLIITYLP